MLFLIRLLVLCSRAADVAAQTIYRCEMVEVRSQWVGNSVVIGLDASGKRAVVSDSVALAFNDGRPAVAKVSKARGQSLRLRWRVDVRDSHNQTATMNYTALLDRGSGKIRVEALPLNFDGQRFKHRGTCRTMSAAEVQAFRRAIGS